MKHCVYCGVSLPDEARFCEYCGQPQPEMPAVNTPEPVQPTPPAAPAPTYTEQAPAPATTAAPVYSEQAPAPKSASALPWVAIIVLSVVLLIGVVVFAVWQMGVFGSSDKNGPDTQPSEAVTTTTVQETTTTTVETTIPTTVPTVNNTGGVVVPSVMGGGALYHVNTSGGVNLRTGPGTQYAVVCGIPNQIDVTMYALQDGWMYISYSNERGWVKADYMAPGAAWQYPVTWFQSPYYVTCIEGDGINVRSGPGTSYSRVCGVPYGYSMQAFGRSGDWLYVYYPTAGKEGWVHDAYVR